MLFDVDIKRAKSISESSVMIWNSALFNRALIVGPPPAAKTISTDFQSPERMSVPANVVKSVKILFPSGISSESCSLRMEIRMYLLTYSLKDQNDYSYTQGGDGTSGKYLM